MIREVSYMSKEEAIERLKSLKANDEQIKEKISGLEYRINQYKKDIQNGIDHIKRYSQRQKDAVRELTSLQLAEKEDNSHDFTKDVEAILEHKYAKGVVVEDKIVKIYTDYIDIFDQDGNRYEGNMYEIILNFNDMDVKVYGLDYDRLHKGCWAGGDCAHPHVSQYNGYCCLGDAGSMMAMNQNEYELYACYITMVNYLQQVNVEDSAGGYIINWKCIDEDGNELENPHLKDKKECNICSHIDDEDEMYYCEDCGEWMCSEHAYWYKEGHHYVCQSCKDEGYRWCYKCDELHPKEELTTVNYNKYCESCLDETFIYCDECEEYKRKNNVEWVESTNMNVCGACMSEIYDRCDDCGEDFRKEDLTGTDNGALCDDCHERYLEDNKKEEGKDNE